jgi:DNA adenine methylase
MMRNNTPLRYPGGKQKLAPFISEIIVENKLEGGHYAEPYAGGAGVAIELLLNGKSSHIHLNDACVPLYAFWRSVISRTDEFCRRIARASLTIVEWRKQREILRNPKGVSQLDLGFSYFFLNRCNRSGIASGGVIGGLAQTGKWKIDARFPRKELIRRVELIGSRRSSITIKNWDAERFILEYLPSLPRKTLVYCDPPYFRKADRLYLNHYKPEDHARIARVIQSKLNKPWIVSYDSAPEIQSLYSKRSHFLYGVQYNAGSAYKGSEVFFFSDVVAVPTESSVNFINCALMGPQRSAV